MRKFRAVILTLATLLFAPEASAQRGSFSGVVREDSTGRPIGGAEVAILALKRTAIADANGRYVMADVPAGVAMVVARRLGYEQQGYMVQVVANETREKDIVLQRVATALDTVKVTAGAQSLALRRTFELFEDHKKMGRGKFIDSTELRRRENAQVADLLMEIVNVKIATPPLCKPYGIREVNCTNRTKKVAISPGSTRMAQGSPTNQVLVSNICALQIRLDNHVLTAGGQIDDFEPTKPSDRRTDMRHDWPSAYDLTTLQVSGLIAVEVYQRGSEVPLDYTGPGTDCGLIQLWTAR